MGVYPDISLQQARKIRNDFSLLLSQNIDPQDQQQQAQQAELLNTYEAIAWSWLRVSQK